MPKSRGRPGGRISKPTPPAAPPPPRVHVPLRLAEEPDTQARWWRDPAWPVLAALPFLILLGYPAWIYSAFDHLDPWFYLGYFLNLVEFKSTWFPSRYYGDRLAWTVPGYLIHRLLDPLPARYVLHFACYYLSVGGFYWLMRQAVTRRWALLVAILFGSHGPLLTALGHDFVDAPSITYYILASVCAVRAGRTAKPGLWLFCSGLFSAAMVYSNLSMVLFLLPVAFLYLYQAFGPLRLAWFLTQARNMGIALCGLLTTVLILTLIHYRLEGDPLLLSTSIRYTVETFSQPNPWMQKGWAWLTVARWLVFPSIALVTGLVVLVRDWAKPRDYARLYLFHFALIVASYLAWEMRHGFGLEVDYYSSCMIPAAFLVLGCFLAGHAEALTAKRLATWLGLMLTAVLITWCSRRLGIHPFSYQTTAWWLLIGLASILVQRIRPATAGAVAAWAALLIANFGITGLGIDGRYSDHSIPRMHDMYRRITTAAQAAAAEAGSSPVFFWYDHPNDPYRSEFNAINSTFLWITTMVGDKFPTVRVENHLAPSAKVAILSSKHTPQQALALANQSLSRFGFRAHLLKSLPIQSGPGAYRMIVIRLEQIPPGNG